MRHWIFTAAAIGVILAAACSGDGLNDPRVLPDVFRLVGEASGSHPAGRTAECRMNLVIELHGETGRDARQVEYAGTHGGHLQRTVLDQNGDGISLMPDVYGEIEARLLFPDSVEFILPGNVNTGSRFWDGIGLLAGRWDGIDGSGEWTCAPFDISEGGWVDTSLVVFGGWRIEPW